MKHYVVKIFEDGISIQYLPYTVSAEQVRQAGASKRDPIGVAIAEIIAETMDDEATFNTYTED